MRIEEQPAWDGPVPAVEPTLHFASAAIDPTLVPAFLAPAPVSPGGPAGGRRRRRSRTDDRKPRR